MLTLYLCVCVRYVLSLSHFCYRTLCVCVSDDLLSLFWFMLLFEKQCRNKIKQRFISVKSELRSLKTFQDMLLVAYRTRKAKRPKPTDILYLVNTRPFGLFMIGIESSLLGNCLR